MFSSMLSQSLRGIKYVLHYASKFHNGYVVEYHLYSFNTDAYYHFKLFGRDNTDVETMVASQITQSHSG